MRSRVLGERSVSVRARLAAAPDPPLSTESDIFIPSYMGLISVIRVHKAAMAIMPAPISLTLETQTSVAYDSIDRSEEHTSELQSLMRISYAVFCLKKKKKT